MAAKRLRRVRFALASLVGGALLVAVVGLLLTGERTDVGLSRKLPDGSVLVLRRVVCAANNFTYNHQRGGPILRLVTPILPGFIRSRFNLYGGSFGFGLDTDTNLIVITVNRQTGALAGGWSSTVQRLEVFDDQGDSFDACWGANTLGMPGETVHGWQVRAFPRRSRTLGLRFLAGTPQGGWTNAAEFHLPNPLFSNIPNSTPEPFPATKCDHDLFVTLKEFQSGARMSGLRGKGDSATAARKTRIEFSFADNEQPSGHWRVQKLTLSDATGNHWAPYLDLVKQEFNWATNGTVEFFGALWPGETAWSLDLEAVRTSGFQSNELWEVTLPLPAAGTVSSLTNHWEHVGRTVSLVGFASPGVDHPGTFKWVAKWWREDKPHVYSLALQLGGDVNGWRLSVVKVVDQSGAEVTVMEHGGQDWALQALFLRPKATTRDIRLTLALQQSRFVHFLARPDFVKEQPVENRR
jgi:hypothetical protein